MVATDGTEVGKVEETAGDSSLDIFSGIAFATGLLKRLRYVPAEKVAEITEGRVRLSIGADEFDGLGECEEPPPSKRIVAD